MIYGHVFNLGASFLGNIDDQHLPFPKRLRAETENIHCVIQFIKNEKIITFNSFNKKITMFT